MDSVFFSFVIYPLTQIIELVFMFCKKLFDNTGFAIIGVSCAVSLLTLPLYIVAEHWQQVERDKQKFMKNQIDKIKAVFKGNEQYMILSTYYRQQHYHPIMALRSAFGLLIQIPFFTAAYTCLSGMTALQGHSFLFIKDMGAPDALFAIGSFNVNVLPIAMTLINMVSGYLYTKGFALKDKAYTYGLALLFVVILYNSPAGLVMYWTMNNIFSLVKNIFYKMKNPVKILYYIFCALVTVLICWIFATNALAFKRAVLVSAVFALVYFAPLFVKIANWLIDSPLSNLRDNFKSRLALFAVSSITLTLLIGFYIPTNLISSSPIEFSGIDGFGNPMVFVQNTFVQAVGFFVIWCSLIFFLYHERMQTLIALGLCILAVTGVLNNFAFSGNYGNLSKLLIFTEISTVDSTTIEMLFNIAAIMLALAVMFVTFRFKKSNFVTIFLALISTSLFGMSVLNSMKINEGYDEYVALTGQNGSSGTTSLKPIFHLSKNGKNVIFIYLDKAQAQYVEEIFNESRNNPQEGKTDLFEKFYGFTLYKNTVSFNGHTLLGAPAVYGGYEYTPEEINNRKDIKLVDKQNECLLLLPRIFTEQTENPEEWSAMVTDSTWANYSWIPDLSIYKDFDKIDAALTDGNYLDLWYKEHQDTAKITVTSETLKRNILWYGFFRTSPLCLRPAFYNDGNYWSSNKVNDDYNDYLNGYSVLDYLPRLTDFDSKTSNTFINLTNNAPHDALFLQAPDYRPASQITNKGTSKYADEKLYHSNAGALHRIGEWFDILKSMKSDDGSSVYDNSRIILVADHGSDSKEEGYVWDSKFDSIAPGHYHPLLMFKDFNDSGELAVNNDFMTNADTPILLINGNKENSEKLVETPKNPYTGKQIIANKDNGALINTSNIFMPHHNTSDFYFTCNEDDWIRVKDNIFESNNWNKEVHK